MEMERVDLSLICRTCKCVSPTMKSVFSGFESANISIHNPRIDEMLMACAAVQIELGDGLPNLMCEMCCQSLKNAYDFKRQCEAVDHSLREYCKNMKVNAIKQELQNTDFMESLNTLSNLLVDDTTSNAPNNPTQPQTKEATKTVTETQTDTTSTASAENEGKPNIHPETDYIQFLDNNQMLLTCRECTKMFTTLEGLRSHKRAHAGNTFKCKQCDKEYTRKNHLERHEASHGKKKVHVCKICSKTLTRMEHLKRHLVTHLREKPFQCKTCNRGFNRIEHLHNHSPRCKGEVVHVCPVCNKAFTREDSLEVHKQQHDKALLSLPTIDNLDNIEQHYFEVDYDASVNFSDNSDLEDCFEPQVEVTESAGDAKLEEAKDVGVVEINEEKLQDTGFSDSQAEDVEEECIEIRQEMDEDDEEEDDEKPLATLAGIVKAESNDNKILLLVEENERGDYNDTTIMDVARETEVENEDLGGDGIPVEAAIDSGEFDNFESYDQENADSSQESSDEEYKPPVQTSPNGKRRGRPRIHPPKPKGTGKRGRPVGSKGIKKKPKVVEEEEIGEFPCPLCLEFFDRISQLDKHAKEVHPGLKIHTCHVCDKQFSRPNHLKRHLTSHSEEKPFCCEICTKSFVRKDHLLQHQKLHEQQEDIPCDVCGKCFNRADHLAKHKASRHGIGDKVTVMGEKKYNCEICMKGFTTEKYRDVHMKAHKGDKQYSCRVCEKSFLSKSHLTEHMKFHNEHSKKFLCSECGQRFIRNDYLVIHMRRHRGEKPFKCKFCGKGFPRTTDLTVHERYHTGEKTHLCTVCGRGFGRAYNLTVHMRTHTGEKPYRCTYCDAAFAQGNDLKAHIRRHTGERFQCDLCTESFLMGYLLTQHKRAVHGLNVVSNIRRLQPVHKTENPDEPPPITIPLPKPTIPENLMFTHLLHPHVPGFPKEEKVEEPQTHPPPPPMLAKPIMPENLVFNHLQAQLSLSQMHFSAQRPTM
ncbi:zinc finger protein 652-B-like [Anthonomus grandis grandis]|uniref:zinc finger protein 652-B-like n=1 Tax=Anthonomus grandis grandis TaxID=2921223 RepID=UPI0021666B4C|nr:zinc finger protein 652-B-like [Anthonomus grandis grandis]